MYKNKKSHTKDWKKQFTQNINIKRLEFEKFGGLFTHDTRMA